MAWLRILSFLQSLGAKPLDAVLIMLTAAIGLTIRTKADKKETVTALAKKADKDMVEELKDFINTRIEDIKTLIVTLSKQ